MRTETAGELKTFGPSPRIKVRKVVDTTDTGNDELGVGKPALLDMA